MIGTYFIIFTVHMENYGFVTTTVETSVPLKDKIAEVESRCDGMRIEWTAFDKTGKYIDCGEINPPK